MIRCVCFVTALACGAVIGSSTVVLAQNPGQPSAAVTGDVVEMLNGSKLTGRVIEIRKQDKEFDFQSRIGARTLTRTLPFSAVHAVVLRGSRHVLTPLTTSAAGDTAAPAAERTSAEIKRLIESKGSTPPDWYDDVPLQYPPTLDLTWPLKAEGKWNNQKNVGQYIWDVINPNPGRWQSGIRLLHHCVQLHKADRQRLNRDMRSLGMMYFHLLQDYPRAAFWLQRADDHDGHAKAALAECYWRLGSKPMAMESLRGPGVPLQAIKLLGDMGETQRAVAIAVAANRSQPHPEANLLAGDALRQAGQYDQAIVFYKKVIEGAGHRNEDYEKLHKRRAEESIAAIQLFDAADVGRVANGSYNGNSTGYNGPIHVQVQVASGRIESVKITDHQEKQFYSAIDDTPRRIIARQSVRGVDAISGATITSQAIVNATAEALAGGR